MPAVSQDHSIEPIQGSAEQSGRVLDLAARRRLVQLRLISDLIMVSAGLAAATLLRFGGPAITAETPYGTYLALFVGAWVGALAIVGAYSRLAVDDAMEEFRAMLNGSLLGVALAVTGAFVVKFDLSRGWLLIAFVLCTLLPVGGRLVVRGFQAWCRRRGHLSRRCVVVGTDGSALELASYAQRVSTGRNMSVVGFVYVPGQERVVDPSSVLGPVGHLARVIRENQVSEVLVAPSVAVGHGFEETVAGIDGLRVELMAAPGAVGFLPSRVSVRPLGDRPMLHLERSELRPAARVMKRCMDLALGLPLFLIAVPILVVCAVAIAIDSRGPVLFRQPRAGAGGASFIIWKLRTMTPDAEARRPEVIEASGGDIRLFKSPKDPRITRVGRVLRRTSIDELPQLWNVLLGHMSLVGPRPPIFDEVERYNEATQRRLHVKPGMTGLWQVKGRHELSYDDYVEQDLLYVQNWSLALDLLILARTLPAIVRMRGAQ